MCNFWPCFADPQCVGCREATLSTGIASSALSSCSSIRYVSSCDLFCWFEVTFWVDNYISTADLSEWLCREQKWQSAESSTVNIMDQTGARRCCLLLMWVVFPSFPWGVVPWKDIVEPFVWGDWSGNWIISPGSSVFSYWQTSFIWCGCCLPEYQAQLYSFILR